MPSQRATTTITTGVAGSGKSYARCARFLADEFLRDEQGIHCSNFPVNIEAMGEFVGQRTNRPPKEVASRIEKIPRETEVLWMNEKSGPWEYFAGRDITGMHIAIDEAHNYCGLHHPPSHRKQWAQFCGELRHRGATIEFLTQNPEKLAKEVDREAGLRYSIVNSETRRDPFFKIPLSDWYELRAAFTRKYTPRVWQIEKRSVDGKWVEELSKSWALTPEYWGLYNSYDAPKSGEAGGAIGKRYEYQKRTRRGLLFWFLGRNLFGMLPRVAVLGFIFYLMTGGGGTLAAKWTEFMRGAIAPGRVTTVAEGEGDPSDGEGPPAEPVKIDDPEVLRGHLETTETQLIELRARMAEVVKANKRLLADAETVQAEVLRGTAVVMLAEGVAVLNDGGRYEVGENIRTGEFSGRKIESINLAKREVVLDSGEILRLGRFGAGDLERLPASYRAASGAGRGSRFSTLVRGDEGSGGSRESGGAEAESSDGQRGRDATP